MKPAHLAAWIGAAAALALGSCSKSHDKLPPPALSSLTSSAATTGAGGSGGGGETGGLTLCQCLEGIPESGCRFCVAQSGDGNDECNALNTQCNVTPGCVDILQCLNTGNYQPEIIDECLAPYADPHNAAIFKVFLDLMTCTCARCVPDCRHESDFTCLADPGGAGAGGAVGAGGAGGATGAGGAAGAGGAGGG